MINAIPRALLRRDPITVIRDNEIADAEGNVIAAPSVVTSVDRGFWRELNAAEALLATRRGTMATSQVLLEPGKDLRAGDRVQVFGVTWNAVQVDDLRAYRRVQLRKVQE